MPARAITPFERLLFWVINEEANKPPGTAQVAPLQVMARSRALLLLLLRPRS
jgi:hypothetical protein